MITRLARLAGIAQLVEQLICNQQVGGSSPSTSSTAKQPNMGDFPSGQRGQTVNLLAMPSVVRIHHPPPCEATIESEPLRFGQNGCFIVFLDFGLSGFYKTFYHGICALSVPRKLLINDGVICIMDLYNGAEGEEKLEIKSIISITIEMFALLISLLISFFLMINKRRDQKDRIILWMVLLTGILLFSDVMAYHFRGDASRAGWYIVRISNFLVFTTNYVMLSAYGMCLRLYTGANSKR